MKDRTYWQQLWVLFKKGEKLAFEEIYNEFVDVLFAYGSKITNDHELVKDSIHELFLSLFKYRKNLSNPDYIEFYMFKSLRRSIVNQLLKEKPFKRISEKEYEDINFSFDLEDDYISNELNMNRVKALEKIVRNLDSSKKELLYLKFYSGLNYKEIGTILGLKSDTAQKRMYRLIDEIKKSIGGNLVLFLMVRLKE